MLSIPERGSEREQTCPYWRGGGEETEGSFLLSQAALAKLCKGPRLSWVQSLVLVPPAPAPRALRPKSLPNNSKNKEITPPHSSSKAGKSHPWPLRVGKQYKPSGIHSDLIGIASWHICLFKTKGEPWGMGTLVQTPNQAFDLCLLFGLTLSLNSLKRPSLRSC